MTNLSKTVRAMSATPFWSSVLLKAAKEKDLECGVGYAKSFTKFLFIERKK